MGDIQAALAGVELRPEARIIHYGGESKSSSKIFGEMLTGQSCRLLVYIVMVCHSLNSC